MFFSSRFFQDFFKFIFDFVWFENDMPRCSFLVLILLVLWASWICDLVCDINLDNSQSFIVSNIYVFLFSLLIEVPSCIGYTYRSCSIVLDILFWVGCCCFFSLFLFAIQFWKFLLTYPQAQPYILNHVQSTNKHTKSILHFCYNVFDL